MSLKDLEELKAEISLTSEDSCDCAKRSWFGDDHDSACPCYGHNKMTEYVRQAAVLLLPYIIKTFEDTIDSVTLLATGRCPADLVVERLNLLKEAREVFATLKTLT
jgi:hypothetical protein